MPLCLCCSSGKSKGLAMNGEREEGQGYLWVWEDSVSGEDATLEMNGDRASSSTVRERGLEINPFDDVTRSARLKGTGTTSPLVGQRGQNRASPYLGRAEGTLRGRDICPTHTPTHHMGLRVPWWKRDRQPLPCEEERKILSPYPLYTTTTIVSDSSDDSWDWSERKIYPWGLPHKCKASDEEEESATETLPDGYGTWGLRTLCVGSSPDCTNVHNNQAVRALALALLQGRQCRERFISFPNDFLCPVKCCFHIN